MRASLPRILFFALLALCLGTAACGVGTQDPPAPAPGPDDPSPKPDPEDPDPEDPEPEDPEPEDPDPRLPPEALQASDDDHEKVTLQWSAPAGAMAISIERDGEEIARLPGDAAAYADEEAAPGELRPAEFVDLDSRLDAVVLHWNAPAAEPGPRTATSRSPTTTTVRPSAPSR